MTGTPRNSRLTERGKNGILMAAPREKTARKCEGGAKR